MTTQFDTWLQVLAAGGKGGARVSVKPAVRGEKWEWDIALLGNWTTATLAGSVCASPDAPSVMATVTISAATYDAVNDRTHWVASLAAGSGANSTGSLQADSDGDGVEYLPIAFYFTPAGGTRDMLFGAALPVVGKV